ncbi:MAG: hypothetical protein ACPKPY_00860 [Nitrososphaeraceae archaeon]
MKNNTDRLNEWFVPKFGPTKFRVFIGMLFLPYTGMCISFSIIGSLISETIFWDRVLAIFLIYFFGLGISAHALDNIGSKIRPWGNYFTKKELKFMTICGICISYSIGLYYVVTVAPLLLIIGILEGFFLFAYNLELFKGYFHTNFWFALSWGSLPLLAGYIIQTNSISILAILCAIIVFIFSYLEIRFSRDYKKLKKTTEIKYLKRSRKLESYLKLLSLSIIIFSVLFLFFRLFLDIT